MAPQIIAVSILVLLFIIGIVRGIHLGAAALAAAFGVGVFVAAETPEEVLAGFPVKILLLITGMTYLLAIARINGTVDILIQRAVRLTGGRRALIPWLIFAVATLIAGIGNPVAALVVIPIALMLAGRNGLDPIVMGLAAINGSLAGSFAPTSLYGILTVAIADEGGVQIAPLPQFIFALVVIAAFQAVAQLILGRRGHGVGASRAGAPTQHEGGTSLDLVQDTADTESQVLALRLMERVDAPSRMSGEQRTTSGVLALLITSVMVLPMFGINLDIGSFSLALAVTLSLLFPAHAGRSIQEIDWSTILLISGIVTYIEVLERMGAVENIAHLAAGVPSPLLAVFLLCVFGALVSAFASTTALFPVLIPLALPLVAQGGLPAAGVITALAVSANLVDTSPFSTSGAVMVASSSEADRPRTAKILLRWGMSMTVIGPIVTVGSLVVPSYL